MSSYNKIIKIILVLCIVFITLFIAVKADQLLSLPTSQVSADSCISGCGTTTDWSVWNLCDGVYSCGDLGTCGWISGTDAGESWAQVDLNDSYRITKIFILDGSHSAHDREFTGGNIYCSNDNSSWTNMTHFYDTVNGAQTNLSFFAGINLPSFISCRWIRLANISGEGGIQPAVYELYVFGEVESPTINVEFLEQSIPDVTSTNAFFKPLNVTYNITGSGGAVLDANTPTIFYKTNNSVTDNLIYVNGSLFSTSNNKKAVTNLSNWVFRMSDNEIYPASYNINESLMETTQHTKIVLSSSSEWVKTTIQNFSGTKALSYFEVMMNDTTGLIPNSVYTCNSSYTTGSPSLSPDCFLLLTKSDWTSFNHSHGQLSKHQLLGIPLSNGYIGSVVATSEMQFLIRGSGGSDDVSVHYITQESGRAGSFQSSNNNGASWNSLTGTMDAHFHQFNGNESLTYLVMACSDTGSCFNSSVRTDLLNLSGLPPTSPFPYSPTGTVQMTDDVWINWTEAISPNGYPISNYSVELLNSDFSFNKSIIRIGNETSYLWNGSDTSAGDYLIRIVANDSLGLTSFGFGESFYLNGTANPRIYWKNPLFTNMTEVRINENFDLSLVFTDKNLYAYDVRIKDPSGNLFQNWTYEGLTVSSYDFLESFTPNMTGVWVVEAEVTDSHTTNYIVPIDDKKVGDKIEFTIKKVQGKVISSLGIASVEYIPSYSLEKIDSVQLTDRKTFTFTLDPSEFKGEKLQWFDFLVTCENIHFIQNSGYKAHFVCPKIESWIDFENPKVQDFRVEKQDENSYKVSLFMLTDNVLEFSSIGGLNRIEEHATIKVSELSEVYDISNIEQSFVNASLFDLSTTQGILVHFLFIFTIFCIGIFYYLFRSAASQVAFVIAIMLYSMISLFTISWLLGCVIFMIGLSAAFGLEYK